MFKMITRNLFCWKWCRLYRHSHSQVNKHIRLFSILKQSFITDLILDIDIDDLKAKHEHQIRKNESERLNIHTMVDDALERKCSEVISSFEADKSKILKIIQLEHSILYAEGYAITPPDKMTSKNWIEAISHSSLDERLHYYLFTDHKAKVKAERLNGQDEKDKSLYFESIKDTNDGYIYFEDSTTVTRWGNHRLASAMIHGIPLIFDMEFDSLMNPREIGRTATQISLAYSTNLGHPQPFHFVFTGCQRSNSIYRTLELRHLLTCHHFLVSKTDKSYLDLFPPSKLVYLSPYAKQVIRKFDPSAVYIIGAYSDPKSSKKLGPAKAKEQNIECFKLPIDENIKWVQGSKDLFLHAVVQVLLAVKGGEKWKDAFASALQSKNFRHYP